MQGFRGRPCGKRVCLSGDLTGQSAVSCSTQQRCPHVIAGEHVLPVDKDIETETTDADDQEEMVGDWVGVDGSMRAHCKSTVCSKV